MKIFQNSLFVKITTEGNHGACGLLAIATIQEITETPINPLPTMTGCNESIYFQIFFSCKMSPLFLVCKNQIFN